MNKEIIPAKEAKENILKAAAIPCLNCGEALAGKYCVACGQSSGTHRLHLHEILHDLWHSFTHTDLGLLHLLIELSYRPGFVVRDYVAGKRKKYFSPWSFYILATALYVLAATSTDYLTSLSQSGEIAKNSAQQEALEVASRLFQKHLKLLNFLFIPLLATLTWAFYRKSNYNYAENLVFQAYVYGQSALAFCVVALPLYLAFPQWLPVLNITYSVGVLAYTVVASRQFFQDSWGKTLAKTLLIYLINFIVLFLPLGIYIAYIMMK